MKLLLKLLAIVVTIPIALLVTLLTIIIALSSQPGSIYSRSFSPDGRHYLIARKDKLSELIPMMPGSSSDAPGTVTVYTKDGREVGSVSVSMMQEIYGVRWEKEQVSLRSGQTIKLSK